MATYLVRDIDPDIWRRVKARAARERITLRALVLRWLIMYAHADDEATDDRQRKPIYNNARENRRRRNGMSWNRLALSLPAIIGTAMQVVESFKGAKNGPQKEAAVLNTIKTGTQLAEMVSEKDLLNDAELDRVLAAYIQARVALLNLITKKTAPEGVILPPGV